MTPPPPTPLTPAEIEQIRARADAATEGPWRHRRINTGTADIVESPDGVRITPFTDGTFIAASRMDVPRLLASLDAARAEAERLRKIVDRLPVTADGVSAYPGMPVWVRRYANEDTPIEEDRLIIEPAVYNAYDLSNCYSTREEAEAALSSLSPSPKEQP